MPGIVGLISPSKPPAECQAQLQAMLASMLHERFYESGSCSLPELGIYCGWVTQPHSLAKGASGYHHMDGVVLALSGECFSDEGESKEDSFSATNQGGWIIRRYLKQGDRFIKSLNGLFSGLLVDRRRRRAILFNDRYGVERVYYHETKEGTYFASEAKALLRVLPELRAFDAPGVAQYLAFGCTLEWRTLFRGVGLLPGGSRWCYQLDSGWSKGTYFAPDDWESQSAISPREFESEFEAKFPQIVARYANFSAGGLGISLTGGLDTRMIMACLPKTATPPVCYTFSGRKERTLDVRLAARIAATCGLEHKVLRISDDFLANFENFVDRTIHATDGCSGATGAHEIYFNQIARTLAPVRLTGNFGSEVLRAMSTFKPLHLADELLTDDFRRSVADTCESVPSSASRPVTFAAFREIPWKLWGTLAAGRSQVTFRTPYLDNELVALAFRAPQSLRTSPLPALRFVNRTHSQLGQIPTDRGHIGEHRGPTWALRRLFAEVTFKLDYLHTEGLPNRLASFSPAFSALSRLGFLGLHKFLPVRNWFRQELAGYLRDTLGNPRLHQNQVWNSTFVRKVASLHISGRKNYVAEINAVLTLDAIERLFFRNQGTRFDRRAYSPAVQPHTHHEIGFVRR